MHVKEIGHMDTAFRLICFQMRKSAKPASLRWRESATGYCLPLDATEPRLEPMLAVNGPEDDMAVRLSHVPPRVRFGI